MVKRESLHTVIAGYPWFLDWGRDTLIVVRGLIAAGKTEETRAILKQFARFEQDGTLPNMIRGDDAGNRDTSDAPLWFFVACSDLMAAEGDDDFLNVECNGRPILGILVSMAQSLMNGTPNGIRMDPESGLLFSPSHFTWMDTNHPAGTPREGYPIEIQALWHFALSFLESKHQTPNTKHQTPNTKHQTRNSDQFSVAHRQPSISSRVRASIMEHFFLEEKGYLSDCLHARPGESASIAKPDDALRPNQLFALTLGAITDPTVCRSVLAACEELLVPGAIRSLADRPVRRALEIRHQGELINDPYHPYQGRYAGDEDTCRKPAYHNGTAWTWVFPSFCEAYAKVYGQQGSGVRGQGSGARGQGSGCRGQGSGCRGHQGSKLRAQGSWEPLSGRADNGPQPTDNQRHPAQDAALAWLASGIRLINDGCVGQIPEILDGDFPHTPRGCDAQAWGMSELLRVWHVQVTKSYNQ